MDRQEFWRWIRRRKPDEKIYMRTAKMYNRRMKVGAMPNSNIAVKMVTLVGWRCIRNTSFALSLEAAIHLRNLLDLTITDILKETPNEP